MTDAEWKKSAAHERDRRAKLVPTSWLDPVVAHMSGKEISALDAEIAMRIVKGAIRELEK